jgi:hypothetical protein
MTRLQQTERFENRGIHQLRLGKGVHIKISLAVDGLDRGQNKRQPSSLRKKKRKNNSTEEKGHLNPISS